MKKIIQHVNACPTDAQNKKLTLIFKGSNRCNAGCSFCSVGKAGGDTITLKDMEILVQELKNLVTHWGLNHLTFTFHGGEPMLLGARFIDQICKMIRTLPITKKFLMQSNLLIWKKEIQEVVGRHEIKVGTSIDPIGGERRNGPKGDAFPTWRKNFLRWVTLGSPPGAIFVVTKSARGKAQDLYSVAESLGKAAGKRFGLQINPVYPQGRAAGKEELLISPEEFGEFLIEIWGIWERASRNVTLTPIQSFAQYFDNQKTSLSCSFNGRCASSHIGIDYNLDVANCGRRLDSKSFLGNLRENSLMEIIEHSEEKHQLAQRDHYLQEGECKNCRFFNICHGGCPDDAHLFTGNVMSKFGWCTSYRMLFEAMESKAQRTMVSQNKKVVSGYAETALTTINIIVDASEAASLDQSNDMSDIWILPTPDARVLQFNSGLTIPTTHKGKIRLWVHNAHVKSLCMWEDLLQRRGVEVVVFEAQEIETVMNLLNELRASVCIDILSIMKSKHGCEALEKILDRFLYDSLWQSQVFPFSDMLLNAIKYRPVALINRWGIMPDACTIHISPSAQKVDGVGSEIREVVCEEKRNGSADWLNKRKPCLTCDLLQICNSCLAPGNGERCTPKSYKMVYRIKEVAADISTMLRTTDKIKPE